MNLDELEEKFKVRLGDPLDVQVILGEKALEQSEVQNLLDRLGTIHKVSAEQANMMKDTLLKNK